jgi:hypothetical protein
MRPLKIVSVILGIVFALAGAALVTAGGFGLGVLNDQTDASGFFNTPSQTVGSYGFALTAPDINAQLGPRWEKWVPSRARAVVRVKGTSELPAPLFIGIAPTAQVSKYLSGVTRDRITGIDLNAGTFAYNHVDGTNFPSAPGKQSFWAAKVEGTGTQTLEWPLEQGDWALVIMNADGSPPVAATMALGARFGIITPLVIGLVAGGFVVLLIGGTLIALGVRRRRPAAFVQPRVAWAEELPAQAQTQSYHFEPAPPQPYPPAEQPGPVAQPLPPYRMAPQQSRRYPTPPRQTPRRTQPLQEPPRPGGSSQPAPPIGDDPEPWEL